METTNDFNKPTERLKNKRILITGGTTGIGRAAAIRLGMEGAQVLLCGHDEAHLDHVLQDAAKSGLENVRGMLTDISTHDGVESFFAEADNQLGKIDVLINNAALAWQSAEEGNYQDWERVVKTNLLSYIACSSYAIKRMKSHGEGHIVNVGSMSADVRERNSSVYVATKSAIQGFTEALRKEVNEAGIKVTLIEPGATGTDMQPVSVPEQQEKEQNLEMMTAEDIAEAVVYALNQPKRCDVVDIKLRPHLQII